MQNEFFQISALPTLMSYGTSTGELENQTPPLAFISTTAWPQPTATITLKQKQAGKKYPHDMPCCLTFCSIVTTHKHFLSGVTKSEV